MCNIMNTADLLIIVISEVPIKQTIICIARSVARCACTSDGYTKADALIARAFLILKKSQGNLFILPNKIALCTNMRM